MSLLRTPVSGTPSRPSVLITLKLESKDGSPVDPTDAWLALHEAFKANPHFAVKAAEISPDKHETSIDT